MDAARVPNDDEQTGRVFVLIPKEFPEGAIASIAGAVEKALHELKDLILSKAPVEVVFERIAPDDFSAIHRAVGTLPAQPAIVDADESSDGGWLWGLFASITGGALHFRKKG
jgi:hypothetical protein